MAERLGEALLDLRTNDAAFNAGVTQAKAKAEVLGSQLDRTSGSSKKLAAEMVATGRSAVQMSAGIEQAGQKVTQMAGAQRAGFQQLSFQLNDVATMYALGARPMQIFASQSGQVIQAIQMMTGGTSRLAAFLGGPWGLAITSAVVVLTPFIGKLFEAEDALEAVELAADKMSDAQSILGSVIDTTTGKIKDQTSAAWALARATAAVGRLDAMNRRAEAQRTLTDIRRGDAQFFGPMGFTRPTRVGDGTQDVVTDFVNGRVGASFAIGSLESRLNAGMIDEEAFRRAAGAIANFERENANVQVFDDLQSALNGDQGALQGFLDPDNKTRTRRSSGPTAAERDARYRDELDTVRARIAAAEAQMATSAEERAEFQRRQVELDEDRALRSIENDENLTKAQKEELRKRTIALGEAERDAIEFNKRVELARDAQALADERFRGEAEALQNAAALADTEAERRDIALRLYDAQVEEERIRLQTIISLAAKGDAEAEAARRAQQALDNLNANTAAGRRLVGQQNETEVDRYLRNLNATPGMINEAIDGIRIDGLESLNDGLTRAIMGAESLGEVFSRVADQIIADLLRIAIQQAIIRPLANSLFGGIFGGGSPVDLLSQSSLFAGGKATGGTIPTGKFAVVGERGPEFAYATSGGLGIMSNGEARRILDGGSSGGASVNIPISIDATGADAAALERVRSEIARLRQELPGRIISTVQDADNRRVLSLRGGR